MAKGPFIVFEGIDGSGKSTQAALLARALEARGIPVLLTREPSDSAAGQRLKRLAKEGRKGISLDEEIGLFQEDRREHCAHAILPALAAGMAVVCDRYWYSTVAYQGALGANPEAIERESRREFPAPDLVVYLDISPQAGLERIRKNRAEGLAPAYEKAAFLEKAVRNYARQVGPGWLKLDAPRPQEELAGEILKAVLALRS